MILQTEYNDDIKGKDQAFYLLIIDKWLNSLLD